MPRKTSKHANHMRNQQEKLIAPQEQKHTSKNNITIAKAKTRKNQSQNNMLGKQKQHKSRQTKERQRDSDEATTLETQLACNPKIQAMNQPLPKKNQQHEQQQQAKHQKIEQQ